MEHINWSPLIAIGLFLMGMLFIGYLSSRKLKTSTDFIVGGRQFSMLTVTATQIASGFGGGLMIAHVGVGYKWGFSEMVYAAGVGIGGAMLAIFVAKWLRQQEFFTTTDWMAHQYGESKKLRVLSSFTSMMLTMGWWVAQPVAAGKLLNVLTGIPIEAGIMLAASVVIIYTMSGGILAVAYTDVAQLILMFIAVVIVLPMAVIKAGGFDTIFSTVPEVNLTLWGAGKTEVIGWLLILIPGQMVSQIYHQRIYSAKTDKIARNSMLIKSGFSVLIGLWATLLGMAIYTLNSGIEDKENAMIWVVAELLPGWLSMIMLGAIVAAIVSTADSALHSTVSSITRDIYQKVYKPNSTDKQILRFTKICVVVVGVIGMLIGLFSTSVLSILLMGAKLSASGLFVPLYMGRIWNGGTQQGAIASILAGLFGALASGHFEFVPVVPSIVWGISASAIAYFSVSMITRQSKRA